MRRLMTFFMGMVTGGVLLYGALNYHLVRAQDGLHFVAKIDPQLAATYVDIRNFTVTDWTQHANLAAALMNADKAELMHGSAVDSLEKSMDQLLESVR
jgi:hypothetical protein